VSLADGGKEVLLILMEVRVFPARPVSPASQASLEKMAGMEGTVEMVEMAGMEGTVEMAEIVEALLTVKSSLRRFLQLYA
jgi:hypothetical protein